VSPIIQAIEQGYPPEEILKYISKIAPTLVPKVQKAVSNGYSLKEIVGFLAKTSNVQDTTGLSESQIHARNRQVDSQLAKKGLMAAGALIASPIVSSTLRSALPNFLPSSLSSLGQIPSGANPQTNMPTNPGANNPLQTASAPTLQTIQGQSPQLPSSSQPPVSQTIIPQQQIPQQSLNPGQQIQQNVQDPVAQAMQPTQPAQVAQAAQAILQQIPPEQLLEKSGLKKHVDELSKTFLSSSYPAH